MRDGAGEPRITRVVAYSRVSSAEQALGTSLADQKNALQANAISRGLKVDKFYVESESAVHEKFERREQMQRLMGDLRSGDLILVDKVDRWSRDIEFTYSSVRRIREAGARVYFVGESIDPETPDGDSMLNMRALFAREEHKRIRLRTVGSRKMLRNQGLYAEGLPPVGYKRGLPRGAKGPHLKNTLQIVASDAAIVRDAFRRCVRGESVADIAEHLRIARPDRSWDKKLVARLLRNRVYLGEVKDARGTWIKGTQPPIIDADLFSRAQAGLDSRRLGGAKPTGSSLTRDWLCRTIGVCGKCGAKLGAAYGAGFGRIKKYWFYYRCSRKCGAKYIPVRAADEEIAAMTFDRLVGFSKELAKEPTVTALPDKVIDLAARRVRLRAKHARIIESFHEGFIDKAAMVAAMAKVDRERTRLDAIEAKQKRRPKLEEKAMRAELLGAITGMREAWVKSTLGQRRETLEDLAHRARLERGKKPVVDWRTPAELAEELFA